MSNSISNTQLYQLAQAELRKTSKYKTGSIPEIEIQAKITELSKLSNWEIQAKLNDYFKAQTQEKDGWAIFGLEINQTQQTNNKKQITQNNNQNSIILNEPDTRVFAINLLSNNANNALQAVKNYHNSIGYLSFDAVAQGITIIGDVLFDTLTGRNDYLPLIEQETNIENEIFKLDQLKNHTTSRANFNKGFKDLYGIEFNAEAFQNLQKANNELIQLNSYEALENYFDTGIKEIEKENLNNAGFKVNSILNPIFNNPIKTQEFINNLKSDCKTDEEFKTKIIETLANAKTQATKAKDEILKTTNRETLENNYKLAYKEAMGNYHSEEMVQQYLQTQQANAMLTEIALVMATSMLTMGSSAVQNLATQATTSLGTKIGGQVVKASMTAATASLPAAETVISGLTSKNGKVNLEMAGEQLKNGLIYGSFGAFVSAPLGDKLVSLLKSNPKITSTIMQKIFSGAGFGTEVSLDALFELGISSGEMGQLFKENAQGELLGRFMHMLLGGQAHHATKGLMTDVTLKQDLDANGKTVYTLSLEGKTLYQTDSPEKIIAGIASMTGEAQGLKVKDIETPKPESVNPKSTQPPTGAEKLPAIPIGEHQIRIHLPSGEKVQHELIEFSDGTIRPQTYVNGKLAKNGSTEATIPGMPKLPIGESVVTKKLPNGDEVTIIIFDKMDGSKSFTTYINNKLIKNEPEKEVTSSRQNEPQNPKENTQEVATQHNNLTSTNKQTNINATQENNFDILLTEISEINNIEEISTYRKFLNSRAKNLSKTDIKKLFGQLTQREACLKLKKLVNNDQLYNKLIASCSENGELDRHKLSRIINFETAKKEISELKTIQEIKEFQIKWDRSELDVAQKDILFNQLLKDKLEILDLEHKVPDAVTRNQIIKTVTTEDGQINTRLLHVELTRYEIKKHIPDDKISKNMVENCTDEFGIVDKKRLYDYINEYKLDSILTKVKTKSDCNYLEEQVRLIEGMSSNIRLKLLQKIKNKKEEFFKDEVNFGNIDELGYERIRARMHPSNFSNVKELHENIFADFLDYPKMNIVYEQLEKTIISYQNNGLASNIYSMDNNGLRGRNIVTLPEVFFDKAKASGLKCIIDLRDEASDNIRIKKDKIIHENGVTQIDGVEYFRIPVDHTNGYCDDATIKNLGEFFKKMEAGNFYIGCANGSHRTDFAIALNYALNTNTKSCPNLKYKDATEIRPAIFRIYNKIQKLLSNLSPEELTKYGLTTEVIQKLPNQSELKNRLQRL